jgi:hypothetical protein
MSTPNMPLWEVFIAAATGWRTSMSARCMPPMPPGAAGGARCLYPPRRGALDLGGAVERHRRLRSRREGHDVRAGGDRRSIATRPSTRCPTKSGTCDARRMNHRSGLRDPAGALCPAPRRRCADPGHRLSEWCGHAPMLEEDMALANIASTCSARHASSIPTRPRSKAAGNDEDATPICAMSGSIAICCWSSSRTAISPAPWCGSSSTPPSPISIGAR